MHTRLCYRFTLTSSRVRPRLPYFLLRHMFFPSGIPVSNIDQYLLSSAEFTRRKFRMLPFERHSTIYSNSIHSTTAVLLYLCQCYSWGCMQQGKEWRNLPWQFFAVTSPFWLSCSDHDFSSSYTVVRKSIVSCRLKQTAIIAVCIPLTVQCVRVQCILQDFHLIVIFCFQR